jgi:LmbE family N-acetylglucosaminyl deacetylase
MTELERLEPLPDHDVRRVLCVVAHPDDMSASGT